jgi:hypothetical protein
VKRPLPLATGIVLVITGLIWILQGFDVAFAPQSFMTANRIWAVWGIVALLVGFGLIVRSRR